MEEEKNDRKTSSCSLQGLAAQVLAAQKMQVLAA